MCIVSPGARGLVCALKFRNPGQPPACWSVKGLFWAFHTLLSWVMVPYDPFQKLNKIWGKPSFVFLLIGSSFITPLLCWLKTPSNFWSTFTQRWFCYPAGFFVPAVSVYILRRKLLSTFFTFLSLPSCFLFPRLKHKFLIGSWRGISLEGTSWHVSTLLKA